MVSAVAPARKMQTALISRWLKKLAIKDWAGKQLFFFAFVQTRIATTKVYNEIMSLKKVFFKINGCG